MTNTRILRLIALSVMLLSALAACSISPPFHEFSFGFEGENQDVEILDWRYGDSGLFYTHATKRELATGHIGQGANTAGEFPVANDIYVKWRVKSTGKVYEDTVDLRSRLPWQMNNKIIHFLIRDKQLYVYLIEGYYHYHAPGAPDCPVTAVFRPLECTEIYPDHWQNF